MSDSTKEKHQRVRGIVSLVAGILIGLTFLMSGSGKVFGYGAMPGQTMDFIGAILPDAWLTPQLALFMGEIFFPYLLPWTELCLGILLLLRIWPRFFAAITLPLTMAFMANNIWYISQGQNIFTSCECFGIWEKLFGTLTHIQSLSFDIILFALALTIVLVHPGDFFSSPSWAIKLQKGTKGEN
jgi:uncharacterized membrane protein YphA (DoxX/SURF4 family)